MKQFLLRTLVFATPLVAFAWFIELKIRQFPNDYSRTESYYRSFPPEKIETLILGSSHCKLGLSPEEFHAPTYNYSHQAQSWDIDWLLLQELDCGGLKRLILSVSYFSFFTLLRENDRDARMLKYALYTPYKLEGQSLVNLGISDWLYFRPFVMDPPKPLDQLDATGSIRSKSAPDDFDFEANAEAAFARHTRSEVSEVALQAFRQIQEYCLTRGVELVLVSLPAHATYRSKVLATEQWRQTQQLLTLEMLPGVKYFNWLEHPPFDLDRECFKDSDHLSEEGAKRVSRALQNALAW